MFERGAQYDKRYSPGIEIIHFVQDDIPQKSLTLGVRLLDAEGI
jgi:hypothetical protein